MSNNHAEYLRKLSLVLSSDSQAIEFGQFWVTFTVHRGDMQTPNALDVRIYNLKAATANIISKTEFNRISLSAGYASNIGLLFTGSIKQFRQGRINQLDSYVDITAADSDEAYNFATISASVPVGGTGSQVHDLLLTAFQQKSGATGVSAGYAPEFRPTGLKRGSVMYGMARDECRNFALQNQCKWSLQDGGLTFIPWTSYIGSADIPIISVKTGLIGVPEQTQQGIQIKTLLNSNYKVGQLIQLQGPDGNPNGPINQLRFGLDQQSQVKNGGIDPLTGKPFGLAGQIKINAQGLYYVMIANHFGDTRGQNWYTDMTCLAVDATLATVDQSKALFQSSVAVPINRFGNT